MGSTFFLWYDCPDPKGSQKMVQSVPVEMNIDHTAALLLAQKTGFITKLRLQKELGWDTVRCDSVLDLLVREGIAWIDDQGEGGERYFWFPSLMGGSLE